MPSATKYREYAEECRRIARQLPPDQQKILLDIAEAWIQCALEEDRKSKARKDQ